MMQHDWIPSTLGHGETMCRRCFVTNREAAVLGMIECDAPPPQPANENKPSEVELPDDHNEYEDDGCPTCGDEGFVFDCFDGFCKDAEFGCDDCTRPCPDCGIRYKPAPDGLGEILTEALKTEDKVS